MQVLNHGNFIYLCMCWVIIENLFKYMETFRSLDCSRIKVMVLCRPLQALCALHQTMCMVLSRKNNITNINNSKC